MKRLSTILLVGALFTTGSARGDEPAKASIPAELAVSVGTTMMLSPAVYSSAWERDREHAKTGFVAPSLYALGAQAIVLAGSFFAHTFVGRRLPNY